MQKRYSANKLFVLFHCLLSTVFSVLPFVPCADALGPGNSVKNLEHVATANGARSGPSIFNCLFSPTGGPVLLQGSGLDEVESVTCVNKHGNSKVTSILNQSAYTLHLASIGWNSSELIFKFRLKGGVESLFDPSKLPDPMPILGSDSFNKSKTDSWHSWLQQPHASSNVCNVRNDPRLTVHAKGDGKNNDQPAIQSAIDLIHKLNGGIVYLPPGKYKLDSINEVQLDLKNNIELRGAGRSQTKIFYGYSLPCDNFVLIRLDSVTNCAITNLSIRNVSTSERWAQSKSITNKGSTLNNFLIGKVDADICSSDRIELKGEKIFIHDCVLRAKHTLLFLGTSRDVSVTHNTLVQKTGVNLDLTDASDVSVLFNRFVLDADHGELSPESVRHGLAISFANNVLISKNSFIVKNGAVCRNNDGEAILSEGGGGIRFGEELGAFTQKLELSKSEVYVPGTALAIIAGRGAGQTNRITARNGQRVKTSDWTVQPDETSRYAIFKWSSHNVVVENNLFKNWPRGFWLYHASCKNVVVRKNVFDDCDGILCVPCQNASRGNGQLNAIWNLAVSSNTFHNHGHDKFGTNAEHAVLTSLRQAVTPQGVNLIGDLQATSSLLGNLSINTLIEHNTFAGSSNMKCLPDDEPHLSPLCSYLRVEQGPLKQPAPPAMLGTMFFQNTSKISPPKVFVNGGAYATTVIGRNELIDSDMYWSEKSSQKSFQTKVYEFECETPGDATR